MILQCKALTLTRKGRPNVCNSTGQPTTEPQWRLFPLISHMDWPPFGTDQHKDTSSEVRNSLSIGAAIVQSKVVNLGQRLEEIDPD
jgi:hypothetical protein